MTQATPRNVSSSPRPSAGIFLSARDLTGIDGLSADDAAAILDLADHYVTQHRRRSLCGDLLAGVLLANIFLENSTRTRMSFEIAAKRLGAGVVNMTAEGSSLKKGESLDDTLYTLNAMRPDIVVLRSHEEKSAARAAQILAAPVVNAGDGAGEHPTQALLDALTLRRHYGRIAGLKVAICGDVLHSRVARSNRLLLEMLGATVVLSGPPELLPPNDAAVTADMAAALEDADAVMVLRMQKERIAKSLTFSAEEYFDAYGLTEERLRRARPRAVILHPGPMNRGVEIDAALADDPVRSLITQQVEMGVAVRMACLDLLTRPLRG